MDSEGHVLLPDRPRLGARRESRRQGERRRRRQDCAWRAFSELGLASLRNSVPWVKVAGGVTHFLENE